MAQEQPSKTCSCGSGKAREACCGPAERAHQANRETVKRSVDWLRASFETACDEVLVSDFFGSLPSTALERLQELPDFVLELLQNNSREWLLAEGVLRTREGEVRSTELVLGPGGPLADDLPARQLIEQLGERSLGLYQVEERLPGGGMRVLDLLAPEPSTIQIAGPDVARSLIAGKTFGARLIPYGERFALSGCVYPFPHETALPLRDRLRAALAGKDAAADSRFARALVSTLLVDAWLRGLVPPPRTIVDLESGEPVLLVSDLYDALDWERLTIALAAQDDVEGNRRRGFSRHEPDDPARRARLLIDVDEAASRIEVLARTRAHADEGREWLLGIAGDALTFRGRTIVDPVPALQGAGVPLVAVGQSLPRAEQAAHLQRIYEYAFRHWANEPLALLGGLTPREAVATEAGRTAVLELIARYAREERARAGDEGRPAVDFEFLRDLLGLDRPA